MGIFAPRAKVAPPARSGARVELPESVLATLPDRFVAVGEALASGTGADVACAVTGRELALDGVSLDEALEWLQETFRVVHGAPPGFADARALALGWSEATLGYLHQLTCEDPVTGLASLAHLQSRLRELYRGQLRSRRAAGDAHALVVVESRAAAPAPTSGTEVFVPDLRIARYAENVRAVFAADEPVGRPGPNRLVVVARRTPLLGQRVALLRRMLHGSDGDEGAVRVWIEGLPPTQPAAAALLGELARA